MTGKAFITAPGFPGAVGNLILACRAHFCHLLGLGQVGHSPRGTSGSAGTLDWGPLWSGSQSTCHPQCPTPPDAPYTSAGPKLLHSLPAPLCTLDTPCWPPDAPTPPTSPHALYLCWPLSPYTPCLPPNALLTPQCAPNASYYPYWPPMPH